MSKPTHVLPNSITNATTTLHSRTNGSVAKTLFPVWRQGRGGGTEKKEWLAEWEEYLVTGKGEWEMNDVSHFTCMK